VVVVAEQDRVDRSDLLGGDRRLGQLGRAGAPAEAVSAAGGVEGRIGQQPPAAELDQDGGPPMWVSFTSTDFTLFAHGVTRAD
jgi:hypothetical protein